MSGPSDEARPVERWECFIGEYRDGSPCVDDREDPNGRYVRFEDYDALLSLKNRWGQKAHEALASLTEANKTSAGLLKQRDDLRAEVERLGEALSVANQALLECKHAQSVGPGWYTRGKAGMYGHVQMWLHKGLEATTAALNYQSQDNE